MIIIVIIIIIVMYQSNCCYMRKQNYIPPTSPDPADQDVGSSKHGMLPNFITDAENIPSGQCGTIGHSMLVGGVCECIAPFYGPTCELESWDWKYYAFGIPHTPSDVIFEQANVGTFSGRKSFLLGSGRDPQGCSEIIDRAQGALGFVYDGTSCYAITSQPEFKDNALVTYDQTVPSSIYLRRGVEPLVYDRVFATFKDTFVLRPYIHRPNNEEFFTFIANTVNEIAWTPCHMYNDGLLVGVWSHIPITLSDYDTIIASGVPNPNYYIDRPTTSRYALRLPPSTQFAYVIYK